MVVLINNLELIRYCKHCGKLIPNSMRNHAVYCSRKCNKMHKKRPYNNLEKVKCEICEFEPIHSCQLDIDHKDGNNKNNQRNNLQILCANCHRLKTYLKRDWSK